MLNMLFNRFLLVLMLLAFPYSVHSKELLPNNPGKTSVVKQWLNSQTEFIDEQIKEDYTFFGLASYYNNVSYYLVDKYSLQRIAQDSAIELEFGQWIAVVGRFNVLLIQAKGLSVHMDEARLVIDNPEILSRPSATVKVVNKSELPLISPELNQIRYAHLWGVLAWLANLVESSLLAISAYVGNNWGLTIIIFSILLKFLLLPVGIMTVRFQRKVSLVQAKLAPQLAYIKANHDGEEAHNRLMVAHSELGVSPFFTLKPMLGSFIQVPILIAVFNALGEMPQLNGHPFLWIENLAYPDAIDHFSLSIPLFGDTLSLLPFIMTVVTLFSTVIYQNRHAPETQVKRQKINLFLMAAAFFVLFYPFPAAMVLYWALANILQTIQQQIIKI